LAGFFLVATVYLAAPAATESSDLGTLAVARATALVIILTVLMVRGGGRRGDGRSAGFLALQGVLDAIGVLALIGAAQDADSAVAVVISSAFGMVTVLLAWVLLRESVTRRQWLGIVLAMGGASALTAMG